MTKIIYPCAASNVIKKKKILLYFEGVRSNFGVHGVSNTLGNTSGFCVPIFVILQNFEYAIVTIKIPTKLVFFLYIANEKWLLAILRIVYALESTIFKRILYVVL